MISVRACVRAADAEVSECGRLANAFVLLRDALNGQRRSERALAGLRPLRALREPTSQALCKWLALELKA